LRISYSSEAIALRDSLAAQVVGWIYDNLLVRRIWVFSALPGSSTW
jgi:hypothetical protein